MHRGHASVSWVAEAKGRAPFGVAPAAGPPAAAAAAAERAAQVALPVARRRMRSRGVPAVAPSLPPTECGLFSRSPIT